MATIEIRTYTNGVLAATRTLTVPDPTPEQVNEGTIRQQAKTALQANRDFIAIPAPTTAQTLAQVKALARQNNGVIRLLLGALDGTD